MRCVSGIASSEKRSKQMTISTISSSNALNVRSTDCEVDHGKNEQTDGAIQPFEGTRDLCEMRKKGE